MRVIVTGASGFLGRAVSDRLKRADLDVLGLSRQKINGLMQVADYSESPCGDVLIHLAETNDRGWINNNGGASEQGAARVIHALIDKGYKKVIYASSASIYGDRIPEPRKPDEQVFAVDGYSRIKLYSEEIVLQEGGCVARLANLYGAGMSKTNVLSAILGQLNKVEPLKLNDVTPIRDFLWVNDAANAFLQMVLCQPIGIFNVGSGVGVQVHELAKLALSYSGQPTRQIDSMKAENNSTLILDISKTIEILNWSPNIKLEDGIQQLVSLNTRSI